MANIHLTTCAATENMVCLAPGGTAHIDDHMTLVPPGERHREERAESHRQQQNRQTFFTGTSTVLIRACPGSEGVYPLT